MKRRAFIAGLGGVAAWPVVARGQQAAVPVIGFLNSVSPGPFAKNVAAFKQGLNERGYAEGQNAAIEYRWAEGRLDRLPMLAAELVQHNVTVIFASGGPAPALAAKAAAPTIPIVFILASDPIKLGLVDSFNHPGGTATGVGLFAEAVEPKKLQILHELVPKARKIGLLVNPRNPNAQTIPKELQTAAAALGLQIHVVNAAGADFGEVFTTLVQQRAEALIVAADPFFNDQREALVAAAAQHALPAIYEWGEFVTAGGLVSYGTVLSDAYRQAGVYIGRILKGEKPADLPVMQPTKFELVINIKTAKMLGLEIPQTMLVSADEVIE